MFNETRKIKYTKLETTVTTYENGLESWVGIANAFNDLSIRGKAVCRIDLLESFDDMFKEETRTEYRNAIMVLANGKCKDVNTISTVLKQLVELDPIFESKIINMYYGLRPDQSLGGVFLNELSSRIGYFDGFFRNFFRGKSEFVICVSDGYLYFSIEDINYELALPRLFKVEVLSNARNWKGNIKVIGQ